MKRQFEMRLLLAFHWGLLAGLNGKHKHPSAHVELGEGCVGWAGRKTSRQNVCFWGGSRKPYFYLFGIQTFPFSHVQSFIFPLMQLQFIISLIIRDLCKVKCYFSPRFSRKHLYGMNSAPSHSQFRRMNAKAEGNVTTINASHLRF